MYVILDLADCFVVWVIVWAVAVWMVACGFVCVRWLGLGVCFGLCCFGLRWLVFGLLLFVGVVYYLWWCAGCLMLVCVYCFVCCRLRCFVVVMACLEVSCGCCLGLRWGCGLVAACGAVSIS